MHSKKRAIKTYGGCIVVGVEIAVFCFFYYYGTEGVLVLRNFQKETEALVTCVTQEEHEVAGLENMIISWQTDSFYKEKVAREVLQMARTSEQVYYLV